MEAFFIGIALLLRLLVNGGLHIISEGLKEVTASVVPMEKPLRCFDPNEESIKESPDGKYCVYGVSYSQKDWSNITFQMVEASAVSKDSTDIESTTIPLCGELPEGSVKYGGAWLKKKESSVVGFEQIFFACCTNCSEFMLAVDDLHAKLISLCMAQMPFNRIYATHIRSISVDGHSRHYFEEFYKLEGRMEKHLGLTESFELPNMPFASCFSENFHIVPSVLNNFVCIVYGGIYNPSEVYGATFQNSFTHLNKKKEGYYAGAVNEAILQKLPLAACDNFKPKEENWTDDSVCRVHFGFGFKLLYCCCYGNKAIICQRKASRIVVQRDDVDPISIKQKACVDEALNYTIASSMDMKYLNKKLLKEEIRILRSKNDSFLTTSTANNLLNDLVGLRLVNGSSIKRSLRRRYCSTNITFHNDLIHVEGDMLYKKLKQKGGEVVECEQNFIPDYRSEEIHKKRCFLTLPDVTICPSDADSKVEMHQYFVLSSQIYCCCNHMPFCNYQADSFSRALYSTPNRCQFNNEYQHMFNRFLRGRGSSANHTCLMHFANAKTMDDMLPDDQKYNGGEAPQELLIIPGTNVFPIDYGYELLEDNECAYIESSVNDRHLRMQKCKKHPLLESNFLPLRLFVCECYTEVPLNKSVALARHGKTLCDAKFDIRRVYESMKRLDQHNRCAAFKSNSLRDIFEQRNVTTVSNTVSSACYMKLAFENDKLNVSAGVATRKIVNEIGVHLDHIGYAMLGLSGSDTAYCKAKMNEIFCFCRVYGDKRDAEKRSACNVQANFVDGSLQRAFSHETFEDNEKLAFYDVLVQHAYSGSKLVKMNTEEAKNCIRDEYLCIIKNVPEHLAVSCQCVYSRQKRKRKDRPSGHKMWYRKGVVKDSCIMINSEIICDFKKSFKRDDFEKAVDTLAEQRAKGLQRTNNAASQDLITFAMILVNFSYYIGTFTL